MQKATRGGGIKDKAFTLIELLAVIIVLAVLAVISVPIITGIVETSKKKALESSLWAIDSATKNYYSKLVLRNETEFEDTSAKKFEISNNVCTADIGNGMPDCLDFESENIRLGYVRLYSNNSASICIDDGKYYANKSASSTTVEVGDGRCTSEYSDETKKYLSNNTVSMSNIDYLQEQINDLKTRATSIENGTNSDMTKLYFLNAHPVDSIYTTVSSDEDTIEKMHNKYGGTWEVYGSGRTIISAGTNSGYTFTVGSTGTTVGATTNPLGEYMHQLSIDEMPSHDHVFARQEWFGGDTTYSGPSSIYSWKTSQGGSVSSVYSGKVDSSGSSYAHNNLQPYIVVYMYKRTA